MKTEKTLPPGKNRLSLEKSPYLLQHAENPVDWYPWGEEAFEKARRENKPIFLSIGYSTCHWCHVMAHESFEDPEVAALLNGHYVSIKLDREERPDVDEIYMTSLTRVFGQHGGWPLSMWLTPDRTPFYGGTYFPPEDRWGRPGFRTILRDLADAWKTQESEIRATAGRAAGRLGELVRTPAEMGSLKQEWIAGSLEAYHRNFDQEHGGFFFSETKFPQPPLPRYLLRLHARTGAARALEIVEIQLRAMARGGIYDHLGGGFARYSTDPDWLVPHFEKMLYDNAQLLQLYAEAYRVTRNPEYAAVARETADYLLRDMTGAEGAFTSAEDADSEGVEGKFYVWRREEIARVLDERSASVFCLAYGVSEEGNWTDPHHDTSGLNVLNRRLSARQIARMEKLDEPEVERILAEARLALLRIRSRRVRPGLDDKILTAWNGLAIGALAYAGATLGEDRYRGAARRAARFLVDTMIRDGKLLHRYRAGEAGIDGLLEDYAHLVSGLLDLYEATLEPEWLRVARDLNAVSLNLFADEEGGGFFLAPPGREDLIVRSKDYDDGVLPAANNQTLVNLLRLSEFLSDASLRERAEKDLSRLAALLEKTPVAYPTLLTALDWLYGPTRQIILAGERDPLLSVVHEHFLPTSVVAGSDAGAGLIPMTEGKVAREGNPTAYVCVGSACKLPTSDANELRRQLREGP